MSNTFSGRVVSIGSVERFSEKFSKQSLVVKEDGGKYPKTICFDFPNGNMDALVSLRVDDSVEVTYDVESRLHEASGRWFTSAKGWKVNVLQGTAPTQSAYMDADKAPTYNKVDTSPPPVNDSTLPF
jgi:hypothetical protein